MKKLLVIFAFMAVSINSFAQFSMGIKAFGVASNVSSGMYQCNYADYNVTKLGYGFGLYGEIKNLMGPGVGLRSEVLYNTLGEKAKFSNNTNFNIRLTYIDVPILAMYKVADDRLTFMGGPQLGFCVGGKEIFRDGSKKTVDKLLPEEYNKLDFTFALGVSYELLKNLAVEIRYNIGISNVYTNHGEPTGHNNWFDFGISYRLK